ncbi:MAG TPA: rod shape-determining protein MreD [Vicinamibacterales bacterium]|nr:rod shape-determining protein MreD [Vicinamibacterales bacterium]
MRFPGIVGALVLALLLQTTVAHFVVHGTAAVDLVLVVVVYVALSFGPTAGILAGAAAGLAQDALSTGIIGIGGLAKTVVGYFTGLLGALFIVAKPAARFVVFYLATVLHALIFMGGYELLGLRDFGSPYGGVASQALVNALVGSIAFHVIELLPGAIERRAANRSMRSRRR